jgi:hypothetical protein
MKKRKKNFRRLDVDYTLGLLRKLNLATDPSFRGTAKALTSVTGLSGNFINTLRRGGIIKNTGTKSDPEWTWDADIKPNRHMAEKALSEYRKVMETWVDAAKTKKETPRYKLVTSVSVESVYHVRGKFKDIETPIHVRNGGSTITVTDDNGLDMTLGSVDELRCYGAAFTKAAEELASK